MNVRRFSLLVILTLSRATITTEAQSFDCVKATTPYEKLICSDPDLAVADSQLATAYKTALAQLSDEGKRWMMPSQRSWLKHNRDAAQLDANSLKTAYRYRIDHLQHTLETIGPFKIQWIGMFDSASPEKPDQNQEADDGVENYDHGVQYGDVDYLFPRIENPGPDAARWNRLVEEHIRTRAGKPDSSTYNSVIAHITYASASVISVYLEETGADKHMPHGYSGGSGYIVLLKSGKEMTAADLFNPNSAWKSFLKRKVKAEITKDSSLSYDSKSGMETEVSRWTLSKEGLDISFYGLEVGYEAAGPQEVTIPWSELKPYLNSLSPFPIPLP